MKRQGGLRIEIRIPLASGNVGRLYMSRSDESGARM